MNNKTPYQDNIILLNEIADTLATQFIAHMYPIEDNEPIIIEWISNDPTGTFEYADDYWDLNTVYTTLKYNLPAGKVHEWYQYNLYFLWKGREYYINLESFCSLYDGPNLVTWAEKYKKERDERRLWAESPEWKAEFQKQMDERLKEFQDLISKYNSNG